MLLDPAHPRLKLADQHAMADDGSVVFDDRAAESHDLIAKLLSGRQDIGRDIGPQRVHVRLDLCDPRT